MSVDTQVGRVEEFHCHYVSSQNLRIQFLTYPDWDWLVRNAALRGRSEPIMFDPRVFVRQPTWSQRLITRIPILPNLQRVICRITDPEDTTLAEIFAVVNSRGLKSIIL